MFYLISTWVVLTKQVHVFCRLIVKILHKGNKVFELFAGKKLAFYFSLN